MRGSEIQTGHTYTAKVSGREVVVRVDAELTRQRMRRSGGRAPVLTDVRAWRCTNLATGRAIEVASAQRFRREADPTALARAKMDRTPSAPVTPIADEVERRLALAGVREADHARVIDAHSRLPGQTLRATAENLRFHGVVRAADTVSAEEVVETRVDTDRPTTTTWGKWCDENADLFTDGNDEGAEVERVLLRGETYRGGGGAQPEWTIRLVGAKGWSEEEAETEARTHLILHVEQADAAWSNPSAVAFAAAVRGWAMEAAFVDVLHVVAEVARAAGGDINVRMADSLLLLRDARMAIEDPDTLADERRDGAIRPKGPGLLAAQPAAMGVARAAQEEGLSPTQKVVAGLLASAAACALAKDDGRGMASVVWRAVDAAGIAAKAGGWPLELAGIEPTGRGFRIAEGHDEEGHLKAALRDLLARFEAADAAAIRAQGRNPLTESPAGEATRARRLLVRLESEQAKGGAR